MTDFTPAQLACIEQHRDINVDHEWWDYTYDNFVEVLAAFGIDVDTTTECTSKGRTYSRPKIYFSGFWSQGDGAQFAAALNLAEFLSKGRTALSGEYAHLLREDCTYDVGKRLVAQLTYWEEKLLAYQMHPQLWEIVENTTITADISFSRYNHSGCMTVEVECDENTIEYPDEDTERTLYRAAETMCAVIADNDDWQDFLRGLADDLYDELEAEYDYQTSDEQVWEAIEANELFTPEAEDDESEDEDHPAAHAA